VNIADFTIVPFPGSLSSAGRSSRKALLNTLRASEATVIVDFSDCRNLDHSDMDLLLECAAQVVGRDTQIFFVAGSRVIRVLLEITLLASLVPVFNSLEEALAHLRAAGKKSIAEVQTSQHSWSA
jgi:anti-anti-sigma regulatory factor